jgi:hypothetical protein
MPGQINRLPAGVLGYLGIKNFGNAPSYLADILSGTWDLAPFYLNSDTAYFTNATAVVAVGNLVAFTVPEGQVYFVTDFSIFQVANAASSNTMAPVRFAQGAAAGGSIIGVGQGSNLVGPRGQMITATTLPMILMPGESLGTAVLDFAGVGSVTHYVRYRSLPI